MQLPKFEIPEKFNFVAEESNVNIKFRFLLTIRLAYASELSEIFGLISGSIPIGS